MADIKPIVPLTGELAMPEKVWMQGPPGAAATVTVGTVTTGEPGTDALVTNSGTENAAVLNFTIPRGETGPAGAGVPDGGTVGQLLSKTETGTAWIDPPQSGGGITTLHINVTGINMETIEAIFTADKTPLEMQEASAKGPVWCVVTFAAGLMAEEAVSVGIPPSFYGIEPAFGGEASIVHNDNGNNKIDYAVRTGGSNNWLIDLSQFGS